MVATMKQSLDKKAIWEMLKDVPDPEIPAVSVVDIGIVRDVAVAQDRVVVTITPTYSGCPATGVIGLDIQNHLRSQGVSSIEIERKISPPWTTDWITREGRDKLRAYGIAPPVKGIGCAGSLKVAKRKISCPQCNSVNVEVVSEFGSTPCKAAYRCLDCLEPFDYFKSI